MTARIQDERTTAATGVEAGRDGFLGRAPLALALVVAATALAGVRDGIPAATGCLVGGLLAMLAQLWLARGLAALLLNARESRRAAALIRFVARQGFTAAALYVVVVIGRLPAGWILLGLSLPPATLAFGALHAGLRPARNEA